jgi:hypothetical protein
MKISLEIDKNIVVGVYEEILPNHKTIEVTEDQLKFLIDNLGNIDANLTVLKDLKREKELLDALDNYHSLLQASDYKAIKYAEGLLTEDEYAPIKTQRQAWREEINRLEKEWDALNS